MMHARIMLPAISALLALACCGATAIAAGGATTAVPCPFDKRILSCSNNNHNSESFDDVALLQTLLNRSPIGAHQKLDTDGILGPKTCGALAQFAKVSGLPFSGTLSADIAKVLLFYEYDGYADDGKMPAGAQYKVVVPVHRNRSIETEAVLYWGQQMQELFRFRVRTHGQNNPDGSAMNQFCDDGSTPTGLMSFDLNSPEDDPKDFGPYPVNRAVTGLAGNAAIRRGSNTTFISDIRDGILMHTGEWSGWRPPMDMPNSHGCVHSWPANIEKIWHLLTARGIVVHNNTDGKLPYPYKPQGALSVQCINCD